MRPYPVRSSAQPFLLFFDVETCNFVLVLHGSVVEAPTIIYIPLTHYASGFEVRATSSSFSWDQREQLLKWSPDVAKEFNQLIVCLVGMFDAAALPSRAQTLLPITTALATFENSQRRE